MAKYFRNICYATSFILFMNFFDFLPDNKIDLDVRNQIAGMVCVSLVLALLFTLLEKLNDYLFEKQ